MRPRHYAEDKAPSGAEAELLAAASMRPRHYAEDKPRPGSPPAAGKSASMRPRHYAEDKLLCNSPVVNWVAGFNEASALRRG